MPPVPSPNQIVADASAAALAWRDEQVLPVLQQATRHAPHEPRGWQMLGLAYRNLDRREEALTALARAALLAPDDPLIAHALARTSLEAGRSARESFDRALALAPVDGAVLLGRAAALAAEGELPQAIASLDAVLCEHATWYDGHAALARLRWAAGERDRYDTSFDRALAQYPDDGVLWRERALLALRAARFEHVHRIVSDARRHLGRSRILDLIEAAAWSEGGEAAAADVAFPPAALVEPAEFRVHQLRHLLRRGRVGAVVRLVEPLVAGGEVPRDLWPLVSLAWRSTGDPRAAWLDQDKAAVRVFDLGDRAGPLDELAETLRALHRTVAAPLDQSVRGGTQTDGPLFARLEPPIQRLRGAVLEAVSRYVAALPPPSPGHPLLGAPRAPLRFAGSWSVRLTGAGHHVDHVHPEGWISSALYVAVPDAGGGTADRAGWLVVGDAPSLGVDVPATREIAPRPGQLVLFPSTTWHRTRAFPAGERLTVAFDIARPPG